jgi:hypothetical protein
MSDTILPALPLAATRAPRAPFPRDLRNGFAPLNRLCADHDAFV